MIEIAVVDTSSSTRCSRDPAGGMTVLANYLFDFCDRRQKLYE